ncbi:BON domain-containing protein [Aquabacterium sp. J223]|uniref:BON domain-containing protein n=1 Tax=Aquabacterium sp. J223 TaxID=2898431 RepID=UPI0021ADF2C7|nr:BON domain-containing protein [Aquabacterium sp. J223]UUX96231.1 BON domain-containing protein [Aquabacterium sp. J223]
MTPTTFRSVARRARALPLLALLIAGSGLLSGCAPLLLGGAAVGGALMATDRRTSGVQVEDQAIELKAVNRLNAALGDRAHVSVVSYNLLVLATGEVPTEADRATVERVLRGIENVRNVINETAVMGASSLTSRTNDAVLTSKVKATLVDAKDVQANAFKVTTERGTVYLMGRVTEREASRAVELTRSVGGVQRVVRVVELLTEAELANLAPPNPRPAPATGTAPR